MLVLAGHWEPVAKQELAQPEQPARPLGPVALVALLAVVQQGEPASLAVPAAGPFSVQPVAGPSGPGALPSGQAVQPSVREASFLAGQAVVEAVLAELQQAAIPQAVLSLELRHR